MSKNSSSKESKATKAGKGTQISAEVVAAREALIDEEALGLVPEGDFKDLVGERCVGFFLPKSGNVIQGTIVDVFETESRFRQRGEEPQKKRVYKIRVTKVFDAHPTIVIPTDAENDDDLINGSQAEVGDLIGVDEKGFLKGLAKCAVNQEVWIACLGKMGRSADYPQGAWRYVVKARPVVVDEVTGEVMPAATSKKKTQSRSRSLPPLPAIREEDLPF